MINIFTLSSLRTSINFTQCHWRCFSVKNVASGSSKYSIAADGSTAKFTGVGIICWPEVSYANARDQSGKLGIVDRKLPDRKPIYFYEWHATRTSSAFFNNIWPFATFDYLPQLRIFLPHTSGGTAILTKNVSIFSQRQEYWTVGTFEHKIPPMVCNRQTCLEEVFGITL